MTLYIIIGNVHLAPLAVYTDPVEARECDEIKAFTDGYEFMRERHSDIDDFTVIDYEQKTVCEFGPTTNHKTVKIYKMELHRPTCQCCERTDNLKQLTTLGSTWNECPTHYAMSNRE